MERVIWQLPEVDAERPHELKYPLVCARDGSRLVGTTTSVVRVITGTKDRKSNRLLRNITPLSGGDQPTKRAAVGAPGLR
jgi:hypothetical protein